MKNPLSEHLANVLEEDFFILNRKSICTLIIYQCRIIIKDKG